MEHNKNMIAVAYELHDAAAADNTLIEKTEEGRPFVFLTSCGMVLDDFEKAIAPLQKGDSFDFTLTPDRAYGEYVEERVIDLDKQMFFIEGKFDDEHIKVGGVIPLQNEQGDRFMGSVVEIGTDKVKIDLNHPLAGKTLHFTGLRPRHTPRPMPPKEACVIPPLINTRRRPIGVLQPQIGRAHV